MRRVRTLSVSLFLGALLILTLGAGVASADPGLSDGFAGISIQVVLPEDPGLE